MIIKLIFSQTFDFFKYVSSNVSIEYIKSKTLTIHFNPFPIPWKVFTCLTFCLEQPCIFYTFSLHLFSHFGTNHINLHLQTRKIHKSQLDYINVSPKSFTNTITANGATRKLLKASSTTTTKNVESEKVCAKKQGTELYARRRGREQVICV